MSTKLFIGNLSYDTLDSDLSEAFSPFGEVVSASVVVDRMSGKSRGFGFVEYRTAEDAQKAIDSLDGTTLQGRTVNVSVARERRDRGPGGGRDGGGPRGGGGGGGGFGGGGGGGGPRGGGGGGGGRGGGGGGPRGGGRGGPRGGGRGGGRDDRGGGGGGGMDRW